MSSENHLRFVSYAESFFDKHGDSYLGVGWTKRQEDADARYRVMLELIKRDAPDGVSLLDFGCGLSHLYEYMLKHDVTGINYSGLDLSDKFLSVSRSKFPAIKYYQGDVRNDRLDLPEFDYIVMNGIFTSKCELSFDEMFAYFRDLVTKVFAKARVGVAFNVMSKQVEWEREDLFHLPMDMLASFLTKDVSRHFVIRHDYRLFEYTTYAYR